MKVNLKQSEERSNIYYNSNYNYQKIYILTIVCVQFYKLQKMACFIYITGKHNCNNTLPSNQRRLFPPINSQRLIFGRPLCLGIIHSSSTYSPASRSGAVLILDQACLTAVLTTRCKLWCESPPGIVLPDRRCGRQMDLAGDLGLLHAL